MGIPYLPGGWSPPPALPNMLSGSAMYDGPGLMAGLGGGLGGLGSVGASNGAGLAEALGMSGGGLGAAPVASGIGRFGASALAGGLGGAAEQAVTSSPWLLPGIGARLGAAGPYMALGLAGNIAGGYLQDADRNSGRSEIGRFLQGAGTGAGIGAAVGNFIPIPGVGAGVGALVGGLGGGLYNLFEGGHHGPSPTDQLAQAQSSLNASLIKLHAIDPTTATALRSQIDTMYPLASTDAQKLQLIQSAAQNVAANFGISTSRTGAYSNATDLLNAVQTYQGQHANASAAKYNADEAARAAYMNQMVGQMKPAQQAYGHYMVSQQLEQAQQALLAQQQQAQAMPYMLALQMQQQIGQQYAPYGVTPTQPTTSGTGAGSTGINLASLLQPQTVPAA